MNSDSVHELSLAIVVSIGLAVPVAITIADDRPINFRTVSLQRTSELAASRPTSSRVGERWARKSGLTSDTVPLFPIGNQVTGGAHTIGAKASELQAASGVTRMRSILDQPMPEAGPDARAPKPPEFVSVE